MKLLPTSSVSCKDDPPSRNVSFYVTNKIKMKRPDRERFKVYDKDVIAIEDNGYISEFYMEQFQIGKSS